MEQERRPERRWGAKTADERRATRRRQLMDAAIRTYGERGYRNSSVKAVCLAAGLTERYFYECFENGEDLLRQCFRQVTGELISKMRDAAQGACGGARERVQVALLTYLELLRGNSPAARFFLVEMASISQETDTLVSSSLDEFGCLLLEVLGRRSPGGDVPPLLLRGVVGGGLHVARAWVSNGYAESVDEVVGILLRLYLLVAQAPEPAAQAP